MATVGKKISDMENGIEWKNCAEEKIEIKDENDQKSKCLTCKTEFEQFELEIHALQCMGDVNIEKEISDHDIVNSKKLNTPKNQCNVCQKCYKSSQGLTYHKKIVHNIDETKNHKCTFCDKAFISRVALKSHIESEHDGLNKHKCKVCNKIFEKVAYLHNHVKFVHESTKGKCKYCDKCLNIKSLKKHEEEVHENINSKKCPDCDKVYVKARSLLSHINTIHKNQTKLSTRIYFSFF